MSRTKVSGQLGTRTDRLQLQARTSPYWVVLEKGRALGYRKGLKGGTWIARFHDSAAQRAYKALGAADDISDADGAMVLSFSQAQEKAREWFRTAYYQLTAERVQVGVYTVRQAVEDYLEDRERHGMENVDRVRKDFAAHVLPPLGNYPLERLNRKKIEDWMTVVAASGLRRRGKERAAPGTADHKRSRKASANRIWNKLRAALNHAYEEKHIQTGAGWADVRAFRGTQVA